MTPQSTPDAPNLPDSLLNILGVIYVHRKTPDGGDIYFTRFGLPFAQHLELGNWYEKEWFREHRERLEGTSAVFRVPTRAVGDTSLDLVVKNCRVGEDVPMETESLPESIDTEFNSPWEEFALVMEMRDGMYGPRTIRINTQDPLAIYVPPEKMQLWQSGRSPMKINRILARHPGIDIDILRQYKLIYGWIQGKDIVQMRAEIGSGRKELERDLLMLNRKVIGDLEHKGYIVADMKPVHIILGAEEVAAIEALTAPDEEATRRLRHEALCDFVNKGAYSVVDYELLVRTPPHEEQVRWRRRHAYLDDQRDRFKSTPLPAHLSAVTVFDVPYIFGHVESTGGALWVVGNNGRLFDYFLPERWRTTHSWKLSPINEVFYTITKDQIHIVWKISRVGELPRFETADPRPDLIAINGFNSPFEEFALAQYLNKNGIPTVYVRAIYMTGSGKQEESVDSRRFDSHKGLRNPDGTAVLRADRNYITLRGYFNGSDSWVAEQSGGLCRPVDLAKALQLGIVSQAVQFRMIDRVKSSLRSIGCNGILLEPNDLLLAIAPDGSIVCDKTGRPEVRICNFELIIRR
ncbi:MAG: hypothetical protein JW913_10805 [Chitinispirillaceae bacterium]|nr:hypothetical protein [Chitinispirillaceae bacterium]